MTILQTLKTAQEKLSKKNIPSARLDAEVLLSYVIKKSREFIFANFDKNVTPCQQKTFNQLIKKRSGGIPIAYLIGKKEFFGLEFKVNKNVLIPRPETEMLVEATLHFIKDKKQQIIVDVGTGSGCIAIAIKKYSPKSEIIAVDSSNKALEIAQQNAKHHKVRINFIKSNLLSKLKDRKIDIIVANLPYLNKKDSDIKNEKVFLKYEPAKALYSRNFGIKHYQKLFRQISQLNYQPKLIICEIGHQQNILLTKLAKNVFPKKKISTQKDLAGRNRLLIIS